MAEWSPLEIAKLIKNVFKNGENEWSEIAEEMELPLPRSPNEIALKWKQIKYIMS